MTKAFIFLVTIHRHFSLGSHRLNTSALQLQQGFFRFRKAYGEISPESYLWIYQQSTGDKFPNKFGFNSCHLPSFTISQPTKKPCKPTALVSQSLETRIYVFNYLPLVLHRLYDPSVLGASHSTDILTSVVSATWLEISEQFQANNISDKSFLFCCSYYCVQTTSFSQRCGYPYLPNIFCKLFFLCRLFPSNSSWQSLIPQLCHSALFWHHNPNEKLPIFRD